MIADAEVWTFCPLFVHFNDNEVHSGNCCGHGRNALNFSWLRRAFKLDFTMTAHTISTSIKTQQLPPRNPAPPVAPTRPKRLRRIKRKKVISQQSASTPLADMKVEPPTARPETPARPTAEPLAKAVNHVVVAQSHLQVESPQAIALPAATTADASAGEPPSVAMQDLQIAMLAAKLDALTELMHDVKKLLADRTKAAMEPGTPGDPERGLDAKEAAALLGISRASLYELRKEPGFVQPMQVGKRSVRYARAELLAWQQARKDSKAAQ
ncbi:MAG: helix-turn-helix domain-containing protein [Burkholderiales bacterium]|nr:helix-turn-helix domain-containing protein [Burkholderiales bacterium]